MRNVSGFIVSRLITGLLVVAPIYLTVLLLLKAAKSLLSITQPVAGLLPDWLPAAQILSFLMILFFCFLIGLGMKTPAGRATWDRMENSLFQRLPGYALLRSLTQQLAGRTEDNTWKPAMAEIEEAFVPAFIIEELENGSFTVFVPSVPTPLAGAVYILTSDRVHPLDVPFTQAIRTISQWGSGSKDLLASMKGVDLSRSHSAER
jgi:uncharacterized membrane protein